MGSLVIHLIPFVVKMKDLSGQFRGFLRPVSASLKHTPSSRPEEATMDTGRRDFLATLGVATIGSAGLTLLDPTPAPAQQAAGYWDLSWTGRLTGKHRAIFDIPAIEDGYGVWRSILWRKQYSQVFGLPESDLNTVVNIRHDGIALVMNQEFWARYNVGRTWDVRDPLSRQPTSRNPVVDRTGPHALPGEYEDFSLEALKIGRAHV